MNPPIKSKINWSNVTALTVGLAAAFGVIPEEHKAAVTEAVLIVVPAITIVFRTWFTEK